MIYRFYSEVPNDSVEYIETILPLIGNIVEFEVFRNREETPYIVIENKEIKRYTFILKDDRDNEFWLYTLCGYQGSGSNATLKILQLLGIKDDYNICKEGNNHIRKSNFNPIHKLNLLIAQNKENSYSSKSIIYNSIISVNFKYAYQKHNLIKLLNLFGYFQYVPSKNRTFFEKIYLFDRFENPPYEYYYYTNSIFILDSEFYEFTKEQIETIIKNIVKNNGGLITYEALIE